MRRVGIITTLLLALSASAALALTITGGAITPANAPTGAHFQAGTSASCAVSGTTVTCSSYQVAGVGNANATADLTANYTADFVCNNPAGSKNRNNDIEPHAATL